MLQNIFNDAKATEEVASLFSSPFVCLCKLSVFKYSGNDVIYPDD